MSKFKDLIKIKDKKNRDITIKEIDNPLSNEELNKLYNEYINSKRMSFSKVKILYKNLMSGIESSEEKQKMADEVYKRLINGRNQYFPETLDFIIQYTLFLKYKSIKYDSNGKVKKGYEELELPNIYIRKKLEKSYLGVCNINYISLSYDDLLYPFLTDNLFIERNIFMLIEIIFHEMTHYKQNYEADHEFYTISGLNMIINRVFRRASWYDFDGNYYFSPVEMEAEIEGYMDAFKLGEKYIPSKTKEVKEMINAREQIILEEAVSLQKNKIDNLYYLTDDYNGLGLIASVSQFPDIIESFPQLSLFFNKNGTLKKEYELLSGYEDAKEDDNIDERIYEIFLTYSFNYRDKEEFVLPINLVLSKIEILERLIKREQQYCEDIKRMLNLKRFYRINSSFFKKDYLKIIEERMTRINKYKELVYKYKVIYELDKSEEAVRLRNELINLETAISDVYFDYYDFCKDNDIPISDLNENGLVDEGDGKER